MYRLGISMERIQATSGDSIPSDFYDKFCASGTRMMSRNELACTMSHAAAWKRCAESGQPVMICEDDIICDDFFPVLMNETAQWLKDNPEAALVKFESSQGKQTVGKTIIDLSSGPYSLCKMVRHGSGSAAYMINPDAAEKLARRFSKSISIADTQIYFLNSIKYFQISPAPSVQWGRMSKMVRFAGMESSINSKHTNNNRPGKITSISKNPLTLFVRLYVWLVLSGRKLSAYLTTGSKQIVASNGIDASLERTLETMNG